MSLRGGDLSQLGYRHHRVQRLRRLVARRSARAAEGCLVVEGAKLLEMALDAGVAVESVYLEPGAGLDELVARCLAAGARVFELEPDVLDRVAGTVTPQPVVAVVAAVGADLAEVLAARPSLVVVGADVRDPGNAGALARVAAGAGADAIIYCGQSVDVSNPKTVRASAGAVFHLPVVAEGDAGAVLDALGAAGLTRLGLVAQAGADYTRVDLRRPVAVVVGNEANGLPDELISRLDQLVTIPMAGHTESLNVGVAAAVVCFEAARQRRLAPTPPG